MRLCQKNRKTDRRTRERIKRKEGKRQAVLDRTNLCSLKRRYAKKKKEGKRDNDIDKV